jgi:hypothetical protein
VSNPDFAKVKPHQSLIELGQFYRRDNELYCFSGECETCRWNSICEKELVKIKVGEGTNIRKAFCEKDGWLLAAIDYKQIEIRVAAQLSGEPVWLDAFNRNLDLHSVMARIGWKIPEPNPIPKATRDAAKCCNFGCLFLGCLSGDTLVQTSLGHQPISEILGEQNIWTGFSWQKGLVYKSGVKKTNNIKFSDNSELRATSDHIFFVLKDGGLYEKKVSSLKKGDLVFLPPEGDFKSTDLIKWDSKECMEIRQSKKTSGFKIDEIPEDFYWMVGLLIGDGWISKDMRKIGFLIVEEDLSQLERLEKVLATLGLTISVELKLGKFPRKKKLWHVIVNNISFGYYLRNTLGLTEKKIFPKIARSLNKPNLSLLIEGFYYADSKKSLDGRIGQNNEKGKLRIREMQFLLRRLGVIGRYYYYHTKKENLHTHYCFVTNREAFKSSVNLPEMESGLNRANHLYVDYLSILRLKRYRKNSEIWKKMSHKDRLKTGIYDATREGKKVSYAKFIKAWRILELGGNLSKISNVLKVESIKPHTEEETYDISILTGEQQSYLANGILVHNSPYTLHQQSALSLEEAVAAHKVWWNTVKVYKQWTESQIAFCKKNRYVETFFKRRREMEELVKTAEMAEQKGDKKKWGFVERTSVNSPVQGCLPYDTRILTNKGYAKIGDLYKRQLEKKSLGKVWTGNKWASFTVLDRGEANYTKITLQNTPEFICDDRHKVKKLEGEEWVWADVTSLKTGDILAFARHQKVKHPNENATKEQERIAYLQGFFTGYTGCVYHEQERYLEINLPRNDRSLLVIKKINEIIKRLNPDIEFRFTIKDEELICRKYSSEMKYLQDKFVFSTESSRRVPESIFEATYQERFLFSRGTTIANPEGMGYITKELAKDLYLVFRSIGIDCKYIVKGNSCKVSPYNNHLWGEVISASSVTPNKDLWNTFLPFQIGIISKHLEGKDIPRDLRSLAVRVHKKSKLSPDTLDKMIGGDYPEELHLNTTVKSVEVLPEKATMYTLSVNDSYHQFDSEGIISKNTAADLMKLGMVKTNRFIKTNSLVDKVKILLTVHDELVIGIKDDGYAFPTLREIGRQLTSTKKGNTLPEIPGWKVPLGVDIEVGHNWAEMKDIDELDPLNAEKKKEAEPDLAILILSAMTQDQNDILMGVISRAAASDNSVKMDFRIQVGGKLYKCGSYSKVDMSILKPGIERIPGVTLKMQ